MVKGYRLYKWILLSFLSIVVLWKGIIPGYNQLNSDFPNYYLSAKLYAQGEDVSQFYDNDWFLSEANKLDISYAKFTPFPPSTVFVMLPLSGFKPLVAKQIWTVLNVLLLFGLIAIIRKVTHWDWVDSALMVLLSGFSLINNFYLGQFYLLLTLGLFLAYLLEDQKKTMGAGAILAFGILIKYVPVVYLPVFLVNRSKTLLWTIISLISLVTISIYALGWDAFTTFFDQVFFAHLDGQIKGQQKNAIAFQSFGSLFSNMVGDSLASILTYVVIGGIVGISGWEVRNIISKDLSLNYLFAICGITTMVILPASASYHFLLLLFPLVLFVSQYQKDVRPWNPLGLLILFSGVGWFNIGLTKILWTLDHPIAILLSYPRLGLLLLIWGYLIYLLETITRNDNKIKITQ